VSNDQTFMLCPGCGGKITQDEATVFGNQLVRVDTFGGIEYVEGMGGFFHDEYCFGRMRGWRKNPMPAAT
jgi:hypothetical protein